MPEIECCNNCARFHYYDRDGTRNENRCGVDDEYIPAERQYTHCCGMFDKLRQDSFLEEQWAELSDVPFDESRSLSGLVLAEKWWLFEKGADRLEIWRYFDALYSKGVYALLYGDRRGEQSRE